MDICALRPKVQVQDWLRIERDTFEQTTRRQYPWYRPLTNANATSTGDTHVRRETGQYAVCPNCNNPVQIIGLYSASIKPYGRHLSHDIADLADYDQAERDNCFYYKPLKLTKSSLKPAMDQQAQRALTVLVEEFDRVVALLKRDTGILFSPRLLGGMLDRFRAERGYLYKGTTVLNIPWMFAYFSDSNSLWWQYCRDDSGLPQAIRNALSQIRHETGRNPRTPTTRFLPKADGARTLSLEKLNVCFIKHRHPNANEPENMTMLVSHADGLQEERDLVVRRIDFDVQAFQDLFQSDAQRQTDLLKLARDKLGDLIDRPVSP